MTHETHPNRELVELFDKDGNRHVVSRENAHDLIQHQFGWRWGGGVVQPDTDDAAG